MINLQRGAYMNIYTKDYTSLQEAIDASASESKIIISSGHYKESLVINKSVHLVGEDETLIHLDEHQLTIVNAGQVSFENIKFSLTSPHKGAGITVSESYLLMDQCNFNAGQQEKDSFALLWVESGSLAISRSKADISCNFIKFINGDKILLNANEWTITSGLLAIEIFGSKEVEIKDNNIVSSVNVLHMKKVQAFNCSKNEIKLTYKGLVKPLALVIDNIEAGEDYLIEKNVIESNQHLFMSISSNPSSSKKIHINENKFVVDDQHRVKIVCHHIQGGLEISQNFIKGLLHVHLCPEVMINHNDLEHLKLHEITQCLVTSNKIQGITDVYDVNVINFKKNEIRNRTAAADAVKLSQVDKAKFEQNRISSVDNGITLLNAGDNLELIILKNEFNDCKKRTINIASTAQQKYLKTEVLIRKNVFMRNEKGIHIDDRNLKGATVDENYFSNNKEVIVIIGGKSTSYSKITGNYFDRSNQRIELRSAQLASLTHNYLANTNLRIRGCEEIHIDGNYISKVQENRYKHDICIKAGGALSVVNNMMLTGRKKHERKDVISHLNITSYEHQSATNIRNNKVHENYRKNSWFETYEEDLILYPDDSLLQALRYGIHAKRERLAEDTDINESMRQDFFRLKNEFITLKEKMFSKEVQDAISGIIDVFQIEILEGSDSNDIYRFIAKTNETVEMLKIYMSMEADTDVNTEKRVITVLKNYNMTLSDMEDNQSKNEQDKLKAQLKLLENLL